MKSFPATPDWSSPALAPFEGVRLHRDWPIGRIADHVRGCAVYLATPYTKIAVDERGRWCLARSAEAQAHATRWARRFARLGVSALAPITLSADIVQHAHVEATDRDGPVAALPGRDIDPLDAPRWEAWCRPFLTASTALVVPPIPGWDSSLGVWREAAHMLATMRPVYLVGEG